MGVMGKAGMDGAGLDGAGMGAAKLRAALLFSLADLFFGTIGVLIILILIAAPNDQPRVTAPYDVAATCRGRSHDSFRITAEGAAPMGMAAWLASIPEDRFMLRVGLRPEGGDLSCFDLARKAALRHNNQLEVRGATQAVISVVYRPLRGGTP